MPNLVGLDVRQEPEEVSQLANGYFKYPARSIPGQLVKTFDIYDGSGSQLLRVLH